MEDDADLLRHFVEDDDENSFAELVRRHIRLVYSVALRRVGGDRFLAGEVAQGVFIDVARRPVRLQRRPALAPWLYTATQLASAKLVRGERRRRKREHEAQTMQEIVKEPAHDAAWATIRPVIDDAMLRLKPKERDAVVLRYFDGHAFAEIGKALELSESGARMRVERALEKLRVELERRGVRSTLAALTSVLGDHAVAAPPTGVAAAVTTTALSGASAGGGAFTLINLLTMTKTQVGITVGIVVAGGAMIGGQQYEQAALSRQIEEMHAEQAVAADLEQEIADLAAHSRDGERLRGVSDELARLRNESRLLDAQLREIAIATSARQVLREATLPEKDIYEATELDAPPRTIGPPTFPRYPTSLKELGIPGEVSLVMLVDETGAVVDVVEVDSTHPDFATAAVAEVMTWRYEPGKKDGQNVPFFGEVYLTFRGRMSRNWF